MYLRVVASSELSSFKLGCAKYHLQFRYNGSQRKAYRIEILKSQIDFRSTFEGCISAYAVDDYDIQRIVNPLKHSIIQIRCISHHH
jgi:hypothetical protein